MLFLIIEQNSLVIGELSPALRKTANNITGLFQNDLHHFEKCPRDNILRKQRCVLTCGCTQLLRGLTIPCETDHHGRRHGLIKVVHLMVAEKEGRGKGRDRKRRREMNEQKWNEGMMLLCTVEEKVYCRRKSIARGIWNDPARTKPWEERRGNFTDCKAREKERETRS